MLIHSANYVNKQEKILIFKYVYLDYVSIRTGQFDT